jgi:hypothetical protein
MNISVESRPLHKTQGAGHPAAKNQSQRPRARAPALHNLGGAPLRRDPFRFEGVDDR